MFAGLQLIHQHPELPPAAAGYPLGLGAGVTGLRIQQREIRQAVHHAIAAEIGVDRRDPYLIAVGDVSASCDGPTHWREHTHAVQRMRPAATCVVRYTPAVFAG